MNITYKNERDLWLATGIAAIAIYCVYYFVLLNMPVIGMPTFRIDYFAATMTRADDSIARSVLHARPVSELYVYLQSLIARDLLDGRAWLIIYPFQHIALFVYFFSIVFALQSILKTRLHPALVLASWVVFMASPAVIGGVYKLETIVGTLSRLFGGLSLVAISCWARSKRPTHAVLFIVLYALSIFSKEDFILPPLFLLGWFLLRDGGYPEKIQRHWKLVVAAVALLVGFVVFNKALLPTRSYMDPATAANAPYFMTLAPTSLFQVAWKYVTAYGEYIQVMTIVYVLVALAAIISRRKIPETLLVALILGGLMAPYLIMPNHVFVYYAINWQAWQCIFAALILQIILIRTWRSVALSALTLAVVSINAVAGVSQKNSIEWRKSSYFQQKFDISKNLQLTLHSNREALNAHGVIGVVGVGPGEIGQSPWQNNGETSFYIDGDLGVTSRWILFVKASGPGYAVKRSVDEILADRNLPAVSVTPLESLPQFKNMPLLVFSQDGTGELLEHPSESLLTNPGTLSVRDFAPGASDTTVKRYISAPEDYPFLRGFNNAERSGRWLSDNNVVLLRYAAGDRFELTAYTPPLTSYAKKVPPVITVAFNDCDAVTRTMATGKVSTLDFPVPANCSLRPGAAVNVRIRVDNVVDTSRSTDKRNLGVLGKKLGFTEARP